LSFLAADPRHYQIAVLSSLWVIGAGWLRLDIAWSDLAILLGATLLTQHFWTRIFRQSAFDPRSPLISALSLSLLLRTNSPLPMVATAVAAISSKFIFTWNKKHIFNPTNFALVIALLLTDRVWVSPAQWGSEVLLAFYFACLGGLVINRAARSDVSYAFLLSYAAILIGRALWLGDPLAIPFKQLQSGALLLFTFFMISDPKSTPDSRAGRIVFAMLAACASAYIQFGLYRTNGLLWALAGCSLLTPLLDVLLPGNKYQWHPLNAPRSLEGDRYEKNPLVPRPVGGALH